MTALDWSTVGKRLFETGVNRGVLYVGNSPGVVWAGLISISDSPVGGDISSYYIDGVKYLNLGGSTDYAGTITAYSSPEEFDACEGVMNFSGLLLTEQPKKPFGLSYCTRVGNDTDSLEHGYKIHMIYNVLAGVSSRDYATLSDSVDAMNLSWPIVAKPVYIPGVKPTAHLIVDSTEVTDSQLNQLEQILYGTVSSSPHLPTVDELAAIFAFIPLTPGEDDLILDGGGPGGLIDGVDGGGSGGGSGGGETSIFTRTFADTFNRGDNSETVGGTGWEVRYRESATSSSTWGISGNKAYVTDPVNASGSILESLLLHNALSGNFDMTLQLGTASGGGFEAPVAAFRVEIAEDDGVYGLSYWSLQSDQLIKLRPNEGGSTLWGLSSPIEANDLVRILAVDSDIKIYKNGSLVLEATDTFNQNAVRHGPSGFGGDFNYYMFDSVTILS